MTEQTPPLDENRPWIVDPEELPSRMNWLAVLLNPLGRSPKLHFTRAWTLLLLPRLIAYVQLIQAGRAETVGDVFKAAVLVLALEALLFVAHVRRLNHAGKSPFWAWLVFVPAVLAAGLVFALVPMADEAHEKAVAEYNAEQSAEAGEGGLSARQNARAAGRSGGQQGRRGRRGGRRGGGSGFEAGPPEREPFIIARTVGPATGVWFLGAIGVTLWSLMWMARRPKRVLPVNEY